MRQLAGAGSALLSIDPSIARLPPSQLRDSQVIRLASSLTYFFAFVLASPRLTEMKARAAEVKNRYSRSGTDNARRY
jgi:hypothetical protein